MPVIRYNTKVATPLLAAIIIAVGYLDYRSGFILSLFPLYLIPLLMVAWHETKRATASVALLASAIIALKDTFATYPHTQGVYFYWDELIKVTLLIAISFGMWKIKRLIVEKEKSNAELRQALSEIKDLRQMIPICAWCHSIRNDRGFYERIEVYLGKVTGAGFTHGICPDCLKKHYGHLQGPDQPGQPESSAEDEKK
jgi:hypothetical protein